MALENYTRGQKIFMVTLVVFLAALFTVTGAMMAVFSGGQSAPPDHGRMDGEYIRMVEFQRMRRALSIVSRLDQSARAGVEDSPAHLYARVPTFSVRPDRGPTSMFPIETSLLDVWPDYQDQHVWCHVELVKRAREAGIEPPGNTYLGRVITNLMNEGIQDVEISQGELSRRFREYFGTDLNEYWHVFREAVMVRDYVDSLVARERASLTQIQAIASGNHPELKAEYARLSADHFMDAARREVAHEYFSYRSRDAVSGFGIGSIGGGFDAFEEAYDNHGDEAARSEATFTFEMFKAYPSELISGNSVEIDTSLLRLIYEAVRDEMFTADEEARQNIEQRLDSAANAYARDNSSETSGWTEEDFEQWKEDRRDEYMQHLTFAEARPELIRALQDRESIQQAQAAVAGLQAFIEQRKAEQRRRLDAQLEVTRKEQAVWEGLRDYVRDVRSKFDTLDRQLFARMRNITNRLEAEAEMDGRPEDEVLQVFHSVIDEAVRELTDAGRREAEAIMTTAVGVVQNIEGQLNTKRAQKEEFELEEEKRTDDGKIMSQEEIDARLAQFDLEIRAIQEKIDLRDARRDQVETFTESIQARLAGYQLELLSAKDADYDVAMGAVRELVAEIPLVLGDYVREQRDEIFPTNELDEFSNQVDLVRADFNARQSRVAREAADTRGWNLTEATGDGASVVARFGLSSDPVPGEWTWEALMEDSRYRELEQVEGAREFLENPGNAPGATSSILSSPGRGYLMIRLLDKNPRHEQGRLESRDTIMEIAAIKRARRHAVKAMRKLRGDIIERGWETAVADAREKYGEHFEVGTTVWFTENMDIPGIFSGSDDEFLDVTSSPSATSPDQPFVSRIQEIEPNEGVTELIPEMRNTDLLRRPQSEQWAYTLARVAERRLTPRRMTEDQLEQDGWRTPAQIWRNQHLATSSTVHELITPSKLLEGRNIIEYQMEAEDSEDQQGDR